jgi:hypothetical protein
LFAVMCKDTGPVRPLFMEVPFCDKIFVLTMRAVRSIVTRLALDRMIATPLATFERAGVCVAVDAALVIMTAPGQLVFDFVEFIHFAAIVLWAKFGKRSSIFSVTRLGTFCDPTSDLRSTLRGATVGSITAFLGARAALPSNASDASVLFLLVLAFEFVRETIFDLGVQKPNAVADALKFLTMKPI